MSNTEKQLPSPEKIFEQQNPQDGTLAPWAKKVAQEYAKQLIPYILQQAAEKAESNSVYVYGLEENEREFENLSYETKQSLRGEVDRQSILSLEAQIIKDIGL